MFWAQKFEKTKNKKNNNEEQQEELLKNRNHYKGWTTNKASAAQDRKINSIAISSLTKKNRNLLAEQRKQKRRYHGVYSDDGVESGDKFSKSDNEEIFKKKTNAQTGKRTVAKTKTEPAMNLKKQNKTVHCN